MERSTTKPLTDDDIIWFGKYRGSRLVDVPASYLLFLYDKDDGFHCVQVRALDMLMKDYIERSYDALLKDAPDFEPIHPYRKK